MRPRSHRRNISFLAGIMAGLLVSLTALGAFFYLPTRVGAIGDDGALLNGRTPERPVHVLILGVDERENDVGRADTIMLLRIDSDQVRLLAIPRDTLVAIEGHEAAKANSAYTYGGTTLSKEVIGELLGLPIQHYVKVNLAGFRQLVDLIGGVAYDVPKAMYYHDPYDDLLIDLKPGPQVLDGEKAEHFVRYRYDGVGDDVGRVHRQQEFLKTAAAQAFTPTNLHRLPQLLVTAHSMVTTDVPATEQLRLAYALYTAQQRGAVVQETLPGHGDYLDGISFFLPDQNELDRLLRLWEGVTE
jgi:LCP family protein required for cell wall assembly